MTTDNSYIIELFKDLVLPPITLSNANEIIIPSITSVQIGGKQLILLLQSNEGREFHSLDLKIKKAILDILFILLRRSVYDLVRYASCYTNSTIDSTDNNNATNTIDNNNPDNTKTNPKIVNSSSNRSDNANASSNKQGQSFTKVLFNLLQYYTQNNNNNTTHTTTNNDNNSIALRVIRLISLSAVLGLDSQDIRMIFTMLNTPSNLTISLLQTLKIILKQDYTTTYNTTTANTNNSKALPSYFYNFNGHNSGLYSVLTPPCFYGEYQIMTWFRVEQFVTSTAPNVSPSESEGKAVGGAVGGGVYSKDSRDQSISTTTSTSAPSSSSVPGAGVGVSTTSSYISLISIKSSEYIIEISIENQFLVVYIACKKSNESNKITVKNGYPGDDSNRFRRGVW